VGYTNAGKSTLFNRLTRAEVFQADQLFATLDPTVRRLALPDAAPAVALADTVGFINRLPHELVAAFRSTLLETRSADLLLHVIDVGSEQRERRIDDVRSVLEEIGAQGIPVIEVFNKIDTVPELEPRVERCEDGRISRVWLSAETGNGVDLLIGALAEHFRVESLHARFRLGPTDGDLRAWLYANARVIGDAPTDEGGWEIRAEVPRLEWERSVRGRTRWLGCQMPAARRGADTAPSPSTTDPLVRRRRAQRAPS
jgi:GTP-binding protein HflX